MKFKENVSQELQDCLKELLKQYLKEIPDITKAELKDLKEWVKAGHSPYENGDYVRNDDGGPTDFVNAARFIEERGREFEQSYATETDNTILEMSAYLDP